MNVITEGIFVYANAKNCIAFEEHIFMSNMASYIFLLTYAWVHVFSVTNTCVPSK